MIGALIPDVTKIDPGCEETVTVEFQLNGGAGSCNRGNLERERCRAKVAMGENEIGYFVIIVSQDFSGPE